MYAGGRSKEILARTFKFFSPFMGRFRDLPELFLARGVFIDI